MINSKLYFLFIGSIFLTLSSRGQSSNQGSIWYLGNHSGFDFRYNPPKILTDGKISNQSNRASAITDELGNFLFYTSGDSVWNKKHEIMQNGGGLNAYFSGNPSTSVIVPHPGDGQLFYIFTTNRGSDDDYPPSGFIYSVIDIAGNAGKGSVLQKNIKLLESTATLLSVASHADEKSFWVISHENKNNKFYVYLVSESGISALGGLVTAFGTYLHNKKIF